MPRYPPTQEGVLKRFPRACGDSSDDALTVSSAKLFPPALAGISEEQGPRKRPLFRFGGS
jgi:hypothetical protein